MKGLVHWGEIILERDHQIVTKDRKIKNKMPDVELGKNKLQSQCARNGVITEKASNMFKCMPSR